MVKNPLISIIVPCYNDGNYIHECLDSIYQQTYQNYEIVIINDGSDDDNTINIINKINHPKIKVLQTRNQGPSKARNYAIKHSSGKYILPLDADNKLGRDFIQEAIEVLEKRANVKIVNCDLIIFGAKKGYKNFDTYSIEKLLCENIIECASVYRRSDFDKTKGYNSNMKETFEDWDFWLSILENGGGVHKINKPGIYYRIKKGSRNSSVSQEQFKRLRFQLYNNHKELYAKYFFDPLLSFEYDLIKNSKEYRLGLFLLKPIRSIYKLIS